MGFSSLKSNNPFRSHSSNNDVDDVAPPAGPPPSYAGTGSGAGQGDYAPPPGPPPSDGQQQGRDDYAAPPGPPPSQQQQQHGNKSAADDVYAPPPGPPPPQQQQQPQHNWQEAVPDTSGFPPPPDIFSGWDHSPATNASADQAEAGEAWCRRYPLSPPLDLSRAEPGLRQRGIVPRLITPPAGVFGSSGSSLTQSQTSGSWTVRSDKRNGDCCIIGYPHAYLVQRDSPLATGRPATVYFECYVRDLGRDAGFAVGFTALPYPPFR